MEKKYAVLVVDMLNDFVTGAIGCDRAKAIVKPLGELLVNARKNNVPVIFCNDCHYKGIDNELKLWGDHAIKGTWGAEIIPELPVSENDYIVPKRRYSTAADAYQNNYDVIFANECTNSFTEEDYQYGLKYAKETYGAPNYNNKELFELFKK